MRIRFVVPKLARPSLHRHAFKVTTNTKLLIEHPTEFTVSHSSSSRNRKLSHKRSEGWIEKIAGDLSPADGIWAVAGDDFEAFVLKGSELNAVLARTPERREAWLKASKR